MKSRKKTFWTNIGIYLSIAITIAFNGFYWKTYVQKDSAQIATLTKSINDLKMQKTKTEEELVKTKASKKTYEAATEVRRKELASYGDFLKHISQKPDSIEALQSLIEGEGISIKQARFDPLKRGGPGANYLTFSFNMNLEGPYKSFKTLLYKIPRQAQIFRIKDFKVTKYQNSQYNWEVALLMETYFSG